MNKGELIYLASPYTSNDPSILLERFRKVCVVAGKLISEGFYIFSPIAHTHPISVASKLPGDWQYWEGYDRAIIKNCKCLVVLKLEGWEQSKGVQSEINIAKELGLSVEYIDEYK